MENFIFFDGSNVVYNIGNYALNVKLIGDNKFNVTLSLGETIILSGDAAVEGSIGVNPSTSEIFLPKNTSIKLALDEKNLLVTALEQAGGKFTIVEDGIKFNFNEGDGALELNFVETKRKVAINITGAVTLRNDGKISLDNGTLANLTWADGSKLKITSKGSTGSIGIDSDKGIKITSDDENLSIDLTTGNGYRTEVSAIKGSVYYKDGTVTIEEGSKVTGTGSFGGQDIDVTLEAIGGNGYLAFGTSTNGFIYGADTGALKVTFTLGTAESTFVVNKGAVIIDNVEFTILENTELSTNLQDFIPALYFTTSKVGTYTINGQTITTTEKGLKLTATDDYMSFTTSKKVVKHAGMTFGGAGNVSLSNEGVVLGAGVDAKGFNEGESFILAEVGNVTADSKIFELEAIENIPTKVTVTGTEDGFIFSRKLTKESEEYLGYYDSEDIGKIFTEKFIAHGDKTYRIRTDSIGFEEAIGISKGVTVTGGAKIGENFEFNLYDLITDTEGTFTIDKRAYKVVGDSNIKIGARFEENNSYARKISDLNGTISGDFSGGNFKIGNSGEMKIYNDTDISIIADEESFEIRRLDSGASLKVFESGTYIVNSTEISANAGDIIVGNSEGSAWLADENHIDNGFNNNSLVTGTENADTIFNRGNNVVIDALGGNDFIINNVTATAAKSGNSISGGTGNDTIITNGKNSTVDGGAGADFISLTSSTNGNTLNGNADNDSIYGNAGNDVLNGDDGNDILYGGKGNDTISGGKGENILSGGAGKDIFVYEGGDDLITDYEVGKDKISLSTTIIKSSIEGTNVILETADGKITVAGGAEQKITTVTKIENTTTTLNQIYTADGFLNNKQTAITLNPEIENYTVPTKSSIKVVDGSATNGVTINSGTTADKIIGGVGADNLNGGAGNDTLTGGDGADIFIYSGGNDVIEDYTKDDKISIASGEVSSVGVSGKNITLKIGQGSVKIKNSAGIAVNIDGTVNYYEKGVIYNDDKTNATVTASATLDSDIINLDGSAMSAALKYSANDSDNLILGGKFGDSILGNVGNDTINGNAGSDKIYGGDGNDILYGGKGNDTISGGTGNNTLTGDDGNDVFVFESGKDTITDYTAGKDKIKFTEEITNTVVSGGNVIFETASGKITVQNGANLKITTIDFNNKTVSKNYSDMTSNKNLDWLLYDNNFITGEFGIDEIFKVTEKNYSVGEIEYSSNNKELANNSIVSALTLNVDDLS